MSFFSSLISIAESAWKGVQPVIAEAETLAPIVSAVVPGSGPVIMSIESALNLAHSPTVTADVEQLAAAAKAIVSAGNPMVLGLEAIYDKLMGITPAGQAAVVVPKTTAPTKPTK